MLELIRKKMNALILLNKCKQSFNLLIRANIKLKVAATISEFDNTHS